MFGDIILGSSGCKFLKMKYPDHKITYISGMKVLTETNRHIDHSWEVILPKRLENLFFKLIRPFFSVSFHLRHWLPEKNILQSYMKSLGVSDSKVTPEIRLLADDIKIGIAYLETLNLDKSKSTIAIQSDFGRKWNHSEFLKLKCILKNNYNLIEIGINCKLGSRVLNMRESAAVISLCDLFVGGVSGNLHAAVAVSTPTIATPNVFDPSWDMPQYYLPKDKAAIHHTVLPEREDFCGNYHCVKVTEKFVSVEMGDYSSKNCSFGLSKSCINSITAIKIARLIEAFFNRSKI